MSKSVGYEEKDQTPRTELEQARIEIEPRRLGVLTPMERHNLSLAA